MALFLWNDLDPEFDFGRGFFGVGINRNSSVLPSNFTVGVESNGNLTRFSGHNWSLAVFGFGTCAFNLVAGNDQRFSTGISERVHTRQLLPFNRFGEFVHGFFKRKLRKLSEDSCGVQYD